MYRQAVITVSYCSTVSQSLSNEQCMQSVITVSHCSTVSQSLSDEQCTQSVIAVSHCGTVSQSLSDEQCTQSVIAVSHCSTVSQSLSNEQCMQLAELSVTNYSCNFLRFNYFSNRVVKFSNQIFTSQTVSDTADIPAYEWSWSKESVKLLLSSSVLHSIANISAPVKQHLCTNSKYHI